MSIAENVAQIRERMNAAAIAKTAHKNGLTLKEAIQLLLELLLMLREVIPI